MVNDFTKPLRNPLDMNGEERKLSEKIRKMEEKMRAKRFKRETNENAFLNEQGIRAVDSITYSFWKIFAILCFLTLLGVAFFFGYIVYDGKAEGMIKSYFNATIDNNVQINNEYDIPIENNYEFKNENNFTIAPEINIDCNSE